MHQHTPAYSHYKHGFQFDEYKDTANNIELHDISVSVLYLWRSYRTPQESIDHQNFWVEFFSYHGGHLDSWIKLK